MKETCETWWEWWRYLFKNLLEWLAWFNSSSTTFTHHWPVLGKSEVFSCIILYTSRWNLYRLQTRVCARCLMYWASLQTQGDDEKYYPMYSQEYMNTETGGSQTWTTIMDHLVLQKDIHIGSSIFFRVDFLFSKKVGHLGLHAPVYFRSHTLSLRPHTLVCGGHTTVSPLSVTSSGSVVTLVG